jgi:hypothetical protein
MTTQVPPSAGRGKVPLWRTAIDSYGFVFGNLDRFLALGWILLLIAAAVQIVGALVMGERLGWGAETLQVSPAYVAVNILFSIIFYAMFLFFAVRWHRFYLLDERESVFSEILAARNWRFLGYILLLALAPFLPMVIGMIIGLGAAISGAGLPQEETVAGLLATFVLFAWLATFVLFFVFLRFSLVLPAAAVDRPIGLGEAWRNMRGNTWRYIGAIILVAIPIIIVILILMALFVPFLFAGMHGGGPRPPMTFLVVWNLVNMIFTFFGTAVGITVLSTFYRHIVGVDAPGGGATAGP